MPAETYDVVGGDGGPPGSPVAAPTPWGRRRASADLPTGAGAFRSRHARPGTGPGRGSEQPTPADGQR